MKYIFKKYDISSPNIPKKNKTFLYNVDYDVLKEEEKSLYQIGSHTWTPQKIQELIDTCKATTIDNRNDYQVEGGHLGIVIFSDEVFFFDLNNREKETEDFIWTKEKFINFLEDFKTFVSENS